MKYFEEMEKRGHEEVIFNYFKDVDLKMIVSLHDTTLGRTIGGLRMNRYDSDMDAVIDSLRLSQVMTYQGATTEIDSGGANAVLVGNPNTDKNEAYFRAVGRYIESLKGRLIISPDLGTDSMDFKYIQRETDNTIFRDDIKDNTKPAAMITAYGVYWGIKACAKKIFGTSDLAGRTIAIQGLGSVGKEIVDYLKTEDVTLYVSDLVYDNIKEVEDKYPEIEMIKPQDILYKEVDIFVPCAVGSIIDDENVDKLNCKAIVGPAYNIFSREDVIEITHEKGILYAPVFIVAAGDLFLLDKNLKLGGIEENLKGTKIIYNVLLDILHRAEEDGVSPYSLARLEAMERYRKIDCINNILC